MFEQLKSFKATWDSLLDRAKQYFPGSPILQYITVIVLFVAFTCKHILNFAYKLVRLRTYDRLLRDIMKRKYYEKMMGLAGDIDKMLPK